MEKIQEQQRLSGRYLLLLKAAACFHPHPRCGPASWQLYPAHDGRNARKTKGKRGRALGRGGGGRRGGGGGRFLKGGCSSFLSTSLCWLPLILPSFALNCCVAPPFINVTFLIQTAGCEFTCLQNTVTFVGLKHTIRHSLTWRESRRLSWALPAFFPVNKRRLINFTPSFQR